MRSKMKHFQLGDKIYFIDYSEDRALAINSGKITHLDLSITGSGTLKGQYHVNQKIIECNAAFATSSELLTQLENSINYNPPSILI